MAETESGSSTAGRAYYPIFEKSKGDSSNPCSKQSTEEPLATEILGKPLGELQSLLESAGQLAEYVLEMSRIVAAKAKLNKDVHEATGIVRAIAQKLTAEIKDFDEDKFAVPQQTEEQRHKAEREGEG